MLQPPTCVSARVDNGAIRYDGYVRSGPANVNNRGCPAVVHLDAGTNGRSHTSFDHANSPDTSFLGRIEQRPLFNLSDSSHNTH